MNSDVRRWILLAVVLGFLHQKGNSTACYYCLHFEQENITSEECLARNTTLVTDCDGPCMELSYEDPVTGNIEYFGLECGTQDLCTMEAFTNEGSTSFDSPFNGYTEHVRCCDEDYCNCNTDTCSSIAVGGNSTGFLECFFCVFTAGMNSTSDPCLSGNVSETIFCDGSCMDLSYEDPVTGEFIFVSKDCGSSDFCTPDTFSTAGLVVYNSSFNNYTERIKCCTGNQCNCDTPECLGITEPPKIENLTNTESTQGRTTTIPALTSFSLGTIPESFTHCFSCNHIEIANITSEECLAKNATEIFLCDGPCMELSYEDPDSGDLLAFSLDCGSEEFCTAESYTSAGRTTKNSSFFGHTERVKCCTEDYCNCETPACKSAIDPFNLENSTTTAPNPTEATNSMMPFGVMCFSCKHAILEGIVEFACVENEVSNITECPGPFCVKYVVENLQQSEFAMISYELECGYDICNDSVTDGQERVFIDPLTNVTRRITCCKGDYCNCNTETCLKAANISLNSTTPLLNQNTTIPTTRENTDLMTTKNVKTTFDLLTSTQMITTDSGRPASTVDTTTLDSKTTTKFSSTNETSSTTKMSQDTTSEMSPTPITTLRALTTSTLTTRTSTKTSQVTTTTTFDVLTSTQMIATDSERPTSTVDTTTLDSKTTTKFSSTNETSSTTKMSRNTTSEMSPTPITTLRALTTSTLTTLPSTKSSQVTTTNFPRSSTSATTLQEATFTSSSTPKASPGTTSAPSTSRESLATRTSSKTTSQDTTSDIQTVSRESTPTSISSTTTSQDTSTHRESTFTSSNSTQSTRGTVSVQQTKVTARVATTTSGASKVHACVCLVLLVLLYVPKF